MSEHPNYEVYLNPNDPPSYTGYVELGRGGALLIWEDGIREGHPGLVLAPGAWFCADEVVVDDSSAREMVVKAILLSSNEWMGVRSILLETGLGLGAISEALVELVANGDVEMRVGENGAKRYRATKVPS